jgi:hypothetical protein
MFYSIKVFSIQILHVPTKFDGRKKKVKHFWFFAWVYGLLMFPNYIYILLQKG